MLGRKTISVLMMMILTLFMAGTGMGAILEIPVATENDDVEEGAGEHGDHTVHHIPLASDDVAEHHIHHRYNRAEQEYAGIGQGERKDRIGSTAEEENPAKEGKHGQAEQQG